MTAPIDLSGTFLPVTTPFDPVTSRGRPYSYERMNDSIDTRSDPDTGAATRSALRDAALTAFARNGFNGASVRMITSRAGVNLGAITYHFGSKRALYEAVLEGELRPLLGRVRAAATSADGSALDRIVGIVEAYFEHLALHPELPRLLLQEIAAGREPPAVVRAVFGEVKETIARLQREGAAEGSVRQGHPVLTALSVVSQPVYLSLVAPMLRSLAGIDLAEPETRRLAIAHVTSFVRKGLQPTEGFAA